MRTSKSRACRWVGVTLLLVSTLAMTSDRVFAQVPSSFAGLVLRMELGPIVLRTYTDCAVALRDDGTYDTIYAKQVYTIGPIVNYLDRFGTGKYSVIKDGPSTARIVLSPDNQGAVSTLYFEFLDEESGRVALDGFPNMYSAGAFWLSHPSTVPLVNISSRVPVVSGMPAIAGFIISGPGPRDVLIRVVGPGLSDFGVPRVWADPDYVLYPIDNYHQRYVTGRKGDWDATPNASVVKHATSYIGAFPLKPGSKDAADVVRLYPGGYTVVLSTTPDSSGEALIEVYLLD